MSTRGENEIAARATMPRPKAKKGKKKRKALPLLEVAHDCSVFAVDPGEKSGYSVWDRGNLRSYGECDVFGDMPRALLNTFLSSPGPHVVLIERPFLMRFGSQMGLGTAAKIWGELAKRLGLEKRTLKVYPSTWRSKVLGSAWVSSKREPTQAEELRIATQIVEKHQGSHALKFSPLGKESAPAVCIGRFGSFSPDVLAVLLPKPKPDKSLIPVERVKFGRYAIRSKPRKRIERATDGAAHMVATWLYVDGVVSVRGDKVTAKQFARAQIKLGYDLTGELPDDGSLCDVIRYHAMIPIDADSAQIEAGWNEVADQVERAQKARAA